MAHEDDNQHIGDLMSDPIDDPYTGGIGAGDRSDEWGADTPTTDSLPRDADAPLSDRLGRNPGNLGDDVADLGDLTHPLPEPSEAQM